jgi:hypothetical protein
MEHFVWSKLNIYSLVLFLIVKNSNGNHGIFFTADNMIVCHYAAIFHTKDFCLGIEA